VSTLTREQRNRLVALVIRGAADNLGRAVETGDLEADGIDEQAAYEQVARWMSKLPGDAWDVRLPEPGPVKQYHPPTSAGGPPRCSECESQDRLASADPTEEWVAEAWAYATEHPHLFRRTLREVVQDEVQP
jgi:hypothetical protein